MKWESLKKLCKAREWLVPGMCCKVMGYDNKFKRHLDAHIKQAGVRGIWTMWMQMFLDWYHAQSKPSGHEGLFVCCTFLCFLYWTSIDFVIMKNSICCLYPLFGYKIWHFLQLPAFSDFVSFFLYLQGFAFPEARFGLEIAGWTGFLEDLKCAEWSVGL